MTVLIDWQELAGSNLVGRGLAIWSDTNGPLCDGAISALSDLYQRLIAAGCVDATDRHTWLSGDEELGGDVRRPRDSHDGGRSEGGVP
jgi:hypothetical protein